MELELLGIVRPVDVAGAEALTHLDEQRIAGIVGHLAGEPGARARDAVRDEEGMRQVLVPHRQAHVGGRGEDESGREVVASGGHDPLVEVGERDDELHVVLDDEGGERRDVARVVDPRDDGPVVGVVERRRERVEIGGDGRRARPSERAHDVDALPCACEEDRRHLDVGG